MIEQFKLGDLVRTKNRPPQSKIANGILGEIFDIGGFFYKVWFPESDGWLWLNDDELVDANEK